MDYDDELAIDCQRLALYWMNEQSYYDVEVTPTVLLEEIRVSLIHNGETHTDWFDTLQDAEDYLDRAMSPYLVGA